MKFNKNSTDILIGFFSGIVGTIVGMLLWWVIFSKNSLRVSIEVAIENDVLGTIISLGSLLDLAIFFGFLKFSYDYRARGVLIWSFIVVLITFFLKFM